MLEDRPYLISRVFESTSDQESNWHYLAYHFHESLNSKKRLLNGELEEEEEEEERSKRKKSPHQPGTPDIGDMNQPFDNSDDQKSDEDCSDPNIFNRLTRDLILSCFLLLSRSDYGAVASVNRAFRSMIQDLYKQRRLLGITEHWVYFSCTALIWQAFDPYRGRWIQVPPMPSSPTEIFTLSDKESLAVGTELLVFGREVNSYVVLRYSILTNSWSPGVVMNSPRCLFGSASLRGKAIVAGGTNGCKTLNSAELYNCDTQSWEPLPTMNKARKMCSGVFMDEKFYVIGGVSSEGEALACGEEYDLERGSWREIPNMSAGLNGGYGAPPLVAVVNNELYAAHYADKDLMKYNKENNTWITLGKLPERSDSMNGWGLAFRACGERLIVIGGRRGPRGGMIELNSWIPNGGPPEWNTIATMHSGDFVFNCAVMGC
ncbi:F-box/kelch-repeat protein SKIP11 [Canna indica]|uniref:F-box/kelch-repeat protein SKIP11 n=1 Tax=Canna indica TaxID=4628 RepID=A0AAQ3QBQ7_9LILI|nr:F-box/kelch-repeat protein SKIP11 [Canna indica]